MSYIYLHYRLWISCVFVLIMAISMVGRAQPSDDIDSYTIWSNSKAVSGGNVVALAAVYDDFFVKYNNSINDIEGVASERKKRYPVVYRFYIFNAPKITIILVQTSEDGVLKRTKYWVDKKDMKIIKREDKSE